MSERLALPTPLPVPPPLFVGREQELTHLSLALERVSVALVCGPAGVGKTALVLAASRRWAGPVVYHCAQASEPRSVLIDDARRQLASGPVAQAASELDRLRDLAGRLDQARGLLVLEDLHRLGAEEAGDLLDGLSGLLRAGRVIATARELLPRPEGVDRAELKLHGLSPEAARALWSELDAIYGPSAGCERALSRCQGSPFLLRRAHAGEAHAEDPAAAALGGLSPDERELAAALALSEVRLPVEAAWALLGVGRGRAALQALSRKLIAEVDGAGTCGLHDLLRKAALASLLPDERVAVHGALAEVVAGLDLAPVVKVREVCRHLRGSGREAEAIRTLLDHAPLLVRNGAASELLAGLERVPPALRTDEVRLARARTLSHLLDLPQALDELRSLVASGAEPRTEVLLAFASTLLLNGQLAEAEARIRALLDFGLPPDQRAWMLFCFAVVRVYQGEGADARATLLSAEAGEHDQTRRAFLCFCRAYTHWFDEDDAGLAEPVRRALYLARGIPQLRAAVLAPAFALGMLSRLGQAEDAERALREAKDSLDQRNDPRMRIDLRAVHALAAFERGERREAVAELEDVLAAAEQGGYVVCALWTLCWLGRFMLMAGRRAEGARLLAEAEARGAAVGARGIVALARRSRGFDAQVAEREAAVVLDSRSHELRSGEETVSLKSRPLLRKLLYAMAAAPGAVIDKERLVQAAWGRPYDPAMHDNPLRVNVRYLRGLLDKSGLRIEFDEVGYRLAAPADFVFRDGSPSI